MRCHYEVLEVDKDADDAALKKAYRKAALKWHPDKNPDNPEAHELFQEVVNAYEVLSDKHERAWYDSHRDQILGSGSRHQAGDTGFESNVRPDDEVDLYKYFSSTCYNGYDGNKSFYVVYGQLFTTLAQQELAAYDWRGEDPPEIPLFGSPNSPAQEIKNFYSFWANFSSAKSFSWCDQYNTASAPNRFVRRRMEDENNKKRKKYRKEFNDEVRNLTLFVKKRDRRVAEYQKREAEERERMMAANAERMRREKEERLARMREAKEADWVRAAEEAEAAATFDEWEEDGGAVSGSGSDGDEEVWECVACEKKFRSEGALRNHEGSKQHRKRVAQMRNELRKQERKAKGRGAKGGGVPAVEVASPSVGGARSKKRNKKQEKLFRERMAALGLDGEERAGSDAASEQADSGGGSAAEGRSGGGEREDRGGEEEEERESEDAEEGSLDEDDMLAAMMGMAAGKQSGANDDEDDDDEDEDDDEDDDGDDDEESSDSESDSGSGSEEGSESSEEGESSSEEGESNSSDEESSSEEEESSSEEEESGSDGDWEMVNAAEAVSGEGGGVEYDSDASVDEAAMLEMMMGGGAAKPPAASAQAKQPAGGKKGGKKKPAAAAAAEGAAKGGGAAKGALGKAAAPLSKKEARKQRKAAKAGAAAAAHSDLKCSVCGEEFPSRNQLFKHIKTTGHAALKYA
ncbi:unnamed protein product [Pedinophyceae sp. YPF-701]|nr:unnamed protein product [Pedinophyceae sp. YPF-701]